ncbi:hypothetical protein LSTR_LSTR008111 [Laodelphax striatellus]|uniref:Uncharacterized protein n=1 Tax=Laodelphax striatellus TaxID=195883 RepID=A0A482XDP1_LAOST|nr:hypothetical protein LSTR_LSTR008111 [Laodelphax striatellus]
MDEDEIFAALHEEWGEESDIEFDDSDNNPTYIEEQNVDEDSEEGSDTENAEVAVDEEIEMTEGDEPPIRPRTPEAQQQPRRRQNQVTALEEWKEEDANIHPDILVYTGFKAMKLRKLNSIIHLINGLKMDIKEL